MTDRIILIRSDVRVTSLRSSWLHSTTSFMTDPLRWFADFAMEERWHSSDAFYQHFQGLIRTMHTDGTYDHLILGGVAAMEELAKQIRIYVVVYSDPGNVSWSDSRFYTESHQAGDALVPSVSSAACYSLNQ